MGPPQRPPAGPWGPAQLPEAGLNPRPPREDITVTPEEGWCLGKDGAGGATSQPARLQPGTGPGWGGEGARKCLFPEPALAMGRKGPARPPSLAPRCRWMRGARGFLPLGTDPSPPWFPSAPHPSPPERPRNTSAHRAEQAWPWARGGGGGGDNQQCPPSKPSQKHPSPGGQHPTARWSLPASGSSQHLQTRWTRVPPQPLPDVGSPPPPVSYLGRGGTQPTPPRKGSRLEALPGRPSTTPKSLSPLGGTRHERADPPQSTPHAPRTTGPAGSGPRGAGSGLPRTTPPPAGQPRRSEFPLFPPIGHPVRANERVGVGMGGGPGRYRNQSKADKALHLPNRPGNANNQ